ncbi:MAG: response regulator transcription factor [Lachnospiraceae bacterium]|nr:response regulator transcription factor [Lachnospiraceae bacterium]
MFSVLIVEDDLIQSDTIKKLLSGRYPGWNIYTARSSCEAEALLNSYKIGLFLLDIELSKNEKEPDGIDFGRKIRQIPGYKHIPVIFITGMADKVLNALQEIHCASYIVKPFSPEKLIDAVEYAIETETELSEELLLKDSNGVYQRVAPDSILYLESNGKNIIVHTEVYIITIANYSVTKIQQMLPDYFIRCHRKYIINGRKIISYDKSTQFIHIGKSSIPVGRKHKEELEGFLNL